MHNTIKFAKSKGVRGYFWITITYFEFVFESLKEVFFALSLFLLLLFRIIFLQLGGADDQVELGHGNDPRVTVRPIERDLESDLSNEAWWKKHMIHKP